MCPPRRMFLDAKSLGPKQPRHHPPIMTPGGEKRMLNMCLTDDGARPKHLPLSSHPIALLTPITTTKMNETGTRRYIATMGPATRRTSVGHAKRAHYRSTYQTNNQDLHYRTDLDDRNWSDRELDALAEAVDTYGDMHAWGKISREVGTKSRLDCRRRWEQYGRSRAQEPLEVDEPVYGRRAKSSLD